MFLDIAFGLMCLGFGLLCFVALLGFCLEIPGGCLFYCLVCFLVYVCEVVLKFGEMWVTYDWIIYCCYCVVLCACFSYYCLFLGCFTLYY